jgi:hypothetical protein
VGKDIHPPRHGTSDRAPITLVTGRYPFA